MLAKPTMLALLIFVTSLFVKLSVNPNLPPHDAHPMRQTDTACVIHFFYSGASTPLEPRACLIRPPTNHEGYFFLEFPLYQWLVAGAEKLLASEAWWVARLVNYLLFSLAFWSLYFGTRRALSTRHALVASFTFAWLPSSIFFFGQAIHPDVLMIALLFASWNLLSLVATHSGLKWGWLFLLLLTLLVATRPFAALALPPFAYYLWIHRRRAWAILTISAPFSLYGFWRLWQLRFPEADHAWQNWVLTGQEGLKTWPVLHNLLIKNVMGEVVGKVATGLAVFGFLTVVLRREWRWLGFFLIYLTMIPLYWYLVPAGNVAHQYYAHVYLLPLILLVSVGLTGLSRGRCGRWWRLSLLVALLGLMVLNGYRTSRYFYLARTMPEEVALATLIAESVPAGEKLLYLGQSSLPFSLAFRQGWNTARPPADLEPSLEVLRAQLAVAPWVVVPNFDGTFPQAVQEALLAELELVGEGGVGQIYRLRSAQGGQ